MAENNPEYARGSGDTQRINEPRRTVLLSFLSLRRLNVDGVDGVDGVGGDSTRRGEPTPLWPANQDAA